MLRSISPWAWKREWRPWVYRWLTYALMQIEARKYAVLSYSPIHTLLLFSLRSSCVWTVDVIPTNHDWWISCESWFFLPLKIICQITPKVLAGNCKTKPLSVSKSLCLRGLSEVWLLGFLENGWTVVQSASSSGKHHLTSSWLVDIDWAIPNLGNPALGNNLTLLNLNFVIGSSLLAHNVWILNHFQSINMLNYELAVIHAHQFLFRISYPILTILENVHPQPGLVHSPLCIHNAR